MFPPQLGPAWDLGSTLIILFFKCLLSLLISQNCPGLKGCICLAQEFISSTKPYAPCKIINVCWNSNNRGRVGWANGMCHHSLTIGREFRAELESSQLPHHLSQLSCADSQFLQGSLDTSSEVGYTIL